jgi:hypothetical protein
MYHHAKYFKILRCIHIVYTRFVWISEWIPIISLCKNTWLVFITETESFYCAVRIEYLNVTEIGVSLQSFKDGGNVIISNSFFWFALFSKYFIYPYCMWVYKGLTLSWRSADCFTYIWRHSPYRAVNTLHLGYKNQSIYGVSVTSRCLFSDKYKTHKYSASRAYNCWMLNLLVHHVTSRF